MECEPALIAKRSSACGSSEGASPPIRSPAKHELDLGVRAAHEIDRGGRERLVHRHRRRAVAATPARSPSASRARRRARRGHPRPCGARRRRGRRRRAVEVEAAVKREERQQVVEKADSGRDARAAGAVEVERDAERGLGRRADHGRGTAGRRAPARAESASSTSFSLGRRGVIRIPSGSAGRRALRLEALGERLARRSQTNCRRRGQSWPAATRAARMRSRSATSPRRRCAAPAARLPRCAPREPRRGRRPAPLERGGGSGGARRSPRAARRSRTPSRACAARSGSAARRRGTQMTAPNYSTPRRRRRQHPGSRARARRSRPAPRLAVGLFGLQTPDHARAVGLG